MNTLHTQPDLHPSQRRVFAYARRREPHFARRTAQRGVILVVALVFLVLITLIAIAASSGSLLQQRMVAATRSAQLAQMSGDSALRGAEWQLWSWPYKSGATFVCDSTQIDPSTGCVRYDVTNTALYGPNGTVTEFRTGNNQWLNLSGPVTYTGEGGTNMFTGQTGVFVKANVARDPQYIIECMGLLRTSGPHEAGVSGFNGIGCQDSKPATPLYCTYRITARATGGVDTTVRVVQSTFDAMCPSG